MTLGIACSYAARGWPVFPLRARTKVPATRRGFLDATLEEDRIRAWWARHPNDGIGIANGALVVLDVDVGGKPGPASLAALIEIHGPLPPTWTAATPSGGTHYYFEGPATPPARRLGFAPGLDLLGVGGYVAAPPTRTAVGEYWWIDGGCSLARLPEWLTVRPEPPAPREYAPRAPGAVGEPYERARRYVSKMAPAISGSGGHAALWAVALVVVRGFALPLSDARAVLTEYSARCSPPWSAREIEHKIVQASKGGERGWLL